MARTRVRVGLRATLARVAQPAPTTVFLVVGGGAGEETRNLRLRPELEVVASPRHASVLLVAGDFSEMAQNSIAVTHDQLPPPRATVAWNRTIDFIPDSQAVMGDEDQLVEQIVTIGNALLTDPGGSEATVNPDVDPVEWRGVGPYGHGGKGMTGGTPFGRPLAERAADRDGLELDQLPITIGPWIGMVPAGLQLHVKLQGDIFQHVALGPTMVGPSAPDLFREAVTSPVSIRAIELERTRHHLAWLSDALAVLGLPALGLKTARIARDIAPDQSPIVDSLLKSIRRTGIFPLALNRVRIAEQGPVPDGCGPVSRASGSEDDARLEDPAYRELGFQPVIHTTGSTADRWRQRLGEIDQSMDLVRRAGDLAAFGNGFAEGPRGQLTVDGTEPGAKVLGLLPGFLTGLEWGDAIATLWSLDVESAAVNGRHDSTVEGVS